MEFRRGQGATEYLVLLAVVLIIALISIALLGFFPGLATDAKKTQSDTYWKGQATPFRVTDHSINTAGLMTLTIQNSLSDRVVLTNYTFGAGTAGSSNVSFQGGESRNINFTFTTSPCASGATRYELLGTDIVFSYTTVNGLAKSQGGDAPTKSLVGTCS